MENIGGDSLVVAGENFSRVLVEDEQAGRVGRSDAFMSVVDAGAAVHIKKVAVDENRAVRGVVGPNAGFGGEIAQPQNIRVRRAWRHRTGRRIRPSRTHMGAFVPEWAVIAVG